MSIKHSEEDIQKTIEYLKTNHPELPADREQAIKILNKMQDASESIVQVMEKTAKKIGKVRSSN